jgi:hypothetical protein
MKNLNKYFNYIFHKKGFQEASKALIVKSIAYGEPPKLKFCSECGFGYHEDVPHPPAQCLAWKESKAEPCNTCSHGRKLHSDDGKFCVQAIAGNSNNLPSFCRCEKYEGLNAT